MFYTADSYKGYTLVGEPFMKSGKRYSMAECQCDRCGGRGWYAIGCHNGQLVPSPYDGAVCYSCNGTGVEHKEIRLYDEKEYEAYKRDKERNAKRRADAAEQRRQEKIAKSEERRKEFMSRNAFDLASELTFCIVGNSYPFKDELKENGYKYSRELGWHGAAEIQAPAGCFVVAVPFAEAFDWDELSGATEKDLRNFLSQKEREMRGPSLSEYVGEVGDRLREIEVEFVSAIGFDGQYGYSNLYTFKYGENLLKWFSQKMFDAEAGDILIVSGTVKKHEEYRGDKMTYLSRMIIKNEEGERL